MRGLILGGLGMLGHRVARTFQENFETWATVRGSEDSSFAEEHLPGVHIYPGVDALNFETIERAIDEIQPDVIVNCIGIIKQDSLAYDAITSITINALLPHQLSILCQRKDIRLIHISTDCVFSGKTGGYVETDFPDATDLYGRSKFLGEIQRGPALTLRTSIIGSELRSSRSLLDWFLSQSGTTKGYTQAIFSGLTTAELSRVIYRCATVWTELGGLYQVSADPISKFDLLTLVRNTYGLKTEIQPVSEPAIDRSLNSTRFREATGYQPPSWTEMVAELAELAQKASIGGIHVSAR